MPEPDPDSLGAFLQGGKVKKTIDRRAEQSRLLMDAWRNTMGEACGAHTRDLKCRDGILTVYMDTQVWQQECMMQNSPELAARMRAASGRTIVKIRIKTGG